MFWKIKKYPAYFKSFVVASMIEWGALEAWVFIPISPAFLSVAKFLRDQWKHNIAREDDVRRVSQSVCCKCIIYFNEENLLFNGHEIYLVHASFFWLGSCSMLGQKLSKKDEFYFIWFLKFLISIVVITTHPI